MKHLHDIAVIACMLGWPVMLFIVVVLVCDLRTKSEGE